MSDIWAVLALDEVWRGLIEEDLAWMWSQLQGASNLQNPRENYLQWLLLIQTSPGYWKRLINRACTHAILQRCKIQQVRDFHHRALERLWTQLPGIARPQLCQTKTHQEVFGCFECGTRFGSKAGEAAHMCKKHGQVSKLRSLFDQPSCPSCLKYYHTMLKLKAHLYYSTTCRERLHSMNMDCAIVPGGGSHEDQQREHQHDRYLPPLRGQGPRPAPQRAREAVDIDDHIYGRMVDMLIDAKDAETFQQQVEEYVTHYPISWTRWTSTLTFFKNNIEAEDAEVLEFDFTAIQEILTELGEPAHWTFLRETRAPSQVAKEISELHEECGLLRQWLEQQTPCVAPRAFGGIRIVLHA